MTDTDRDRLAALLHPFTCGSWDLPGFPQCVITANRLIAAGVHIGAYVDYEAMRKEQGWPTPNHMRRTADALDMLTPARYGEVLRWVADLCDAALAEPPSPEPER